VKRFDQKNIQFIISITIYNELRIGALQLYFFQKFDQTFFKNTQNFIIYFGH